MTTSLQVQERVATRSGRGRGWLAFLVRRVAKALLAMWFILTAAFLVLRLSGADPVRAALGATADEALIDARRAELGLDLPLWQQYLDYIAGLFRGEIGISLVSGRQVTELVASRLPATLELSAVAFLLVLAVGVPLGLGAAIVAERARARTDAPVFTSITGFFAALPEYLMGVTLVLVFGIALQWFPVAGAAGPFSFVLPAIALATASAAALARIARVEALAVLKEDYIRTARSKKLPSLLIYVRHALPNMLTATLAVGGVIFGTMITSGVLVESVFNWPGIGQLFVDAIAVRDYGIVQGLALIYSAIVLAILLIVDIVLSLLDPRSTITENT